MVSETVRLPVKVVPGSSRSCIAGWLGETLRVRVTAPPERGKANAAVEELIAEALGLLPGDVRILTGKTSPRKVVEIVGISMSEIRGRLNDRPPTTTQEPAMRLIFEDPSSGTELVRTVRGPDAPATVPIRFEPARSTDRLIGEPTAWANSPGPGQALIFTVPVPGPREPERSTTLRIHVEGRSRSSTVRIPITIKHNL